jgi:hypothetical protein
VNAAQLPDKALFMPEMAEQEATSMITQRQGDPFDKQSSGMDNRWVAGIALVAIGAVMMVGQFADSAFAGTLILPTLGIIFTIWGIATHRAGLMVPAGIFIGLSAGTWLVLSDWIQQNLSEQATGGVFLLAFALGWAFITALTRLFADEMHWWPLIPAGVLSMVGTALLLGDAGLQALVWVGYVWPLGLMAAGLLLLLRQVKDHT